jgi:hypothetical protein
MKDLGSGERASDKLKGKRIRQIRQNLMCIEAKLVLQAKSRCVLAKLSWPLFIDGQVSRKWLGSIQIHSVTTVYIMFPYSNTTYVGSYPRPIFLWALTRIYLRGTNAKVPRSRTLVISPRDSI